MLLVTAPASHSGHSYALHFLLFKSSLSRKLAALTDHPNTQRPDIPILACGSFPRRGLCKHYHCVLVIFVGPQVFSTPHPLLQLWLCVLAVALGWTKLCLTSFTLSLASARQRSKDQTLGLRGAGTPGAWLHRPLLWPPPGLAHHSPALSPEHTAAKQRLQGSPSLVPG